jgi:glycosyltransferase involved in cell wall biosynthesis
MGKPYPPIIAIEIGHLSSSTLSGGDKLMLDLAPYLKSISFSVIIPNLATQHWKSFSSKIIPIPSSSYPFRIFHALKILHQKKPKIVISNTNYFPDIITGFIYKLINPKTIWVVRVLHFILPPHKRPGNYFVNTLAYLTQTFSQTIVIRFSNLALALNSQIFMSLNTTHKDILAAGVDLDMIAKIKPFPTTPKFDIVFIGRLHRTKGAYDLAKIMTKLPHTTLAVIGEGIPLSTHKQITYLGRVNDIKKFQILKKSRIFLCADYEAGWGLAIAEAMACAVPVVARPLSVFGSVFNQGYLTSPDLVAPLQRLLKSPNLYRKISQEALQESRRFQLQPVAKKYISILNHFLDTS